MAAYEVWSCGDVVKLLSPGESSEYRQGLLNKGFNLVQAFKYDSTDICGLSGRKVRVNPSVQAWVQAATLKQRLLAGRVQVGNKVGLLAKIFGFLSRRQKAPS